MARREYEQDRNRNPERREYHRRYAQEQRQKVRELGKCRHCNKPAIPSQTRCPTCAESHRQSRRRSDAMRRATAKQPATTKTDLSDVSQRDTLHHSDTSDVL